MNEHFIETTKRQKEGDWSMADLHSHRYFEMYFPIKGKRQILFEDKLAELEEGSLAVIAPFTMHKTEGGTFCRINVCVAPDAISKEALRILSECARHSTLVFTKEAMERLCEVLSDLLSLEESAVKEASEQKRILVEYLLFFVKKHAKTDDEHTLHTKSRVPPTLLQMLRYLGTHFGEKITLGELSQEFHISEVSICNYFKSYLGVTFGEYLGHLRITKAKELLLTTKRGMDEIAAALGLGSANYFGLFFKRHVGISPQKYRKGES